VGGAVGYLGYDVVRAFERLPAAPEDDLDVPDATFLIADSLVIIDNAFARAILVTNAFVSPDAPSQELRSAFDGAEARNHALLARLREPPPLQQLAFDADTTLSTSTPYPRERYERDVDRVREYIRAGDAFQVVLSRRQDVACAAPPFDVYRCLRMLNPAPYLYYLNMDAHVLAGSSPEVLVRVEEGDITVRPIAGTRPRGATDADDRRLAEELLADPKELAEHTMLVDLGRNDVGRVSEFGSVRITVDKQIERYSHVQHIVSQIEGRLRSGIDAIDALRACFPAGTVSGAPKVRAMEILDELEPTRRGPYAGAVCYLGWGGTSMDTAITIRTALIKNGTAHVQSGGGIVADSVPSKEFEETQNKAGAVLRAIQMAVGSISQG
jgi:anthranilate synthase component 1